MLKKLSLQNYRGFRNHTVYFSKISIVVGSNNAGKSTIIEAIRLVSIVSSRARRLSYREPPDWLDIPIGYRCVSPSLRGIDFDYRNLHHEFSDPPSIVRAFFENGEQISIFLHAENEEIIGVLYRRGNRIITSQSEARKLTSSTIQIMPPTGILAKSEKLLKEDYVKLNLNTNLSHLHFRNQLHIYKDQFSNFRTLTEGSWPFLQIRDLEVEFSEGGDITLFIRDGRFVAEVGWVGQGLQSWLQTTWFLSRVTENDTVVFDEPDVYLHADLQRKLVRFLTSKYRQTIIATHSLEIISDVAPENIVVVEKRMKKSEAASALPAVQRVVDNLGGNHNLQLMRLWGARKCLFIEGDDMDYLDEFHLKLHFESDFPFRTVPNIPIGGAGNWQQAVGASIGLKNAGDEAIVTYCLLDRDYRPVDEIEEIEKKALEKGLDLVFWKRKEIENYLIVPEAISRYISSRNRKGTQLSPRLSTVISQIEKICDSLFDEVVDLTAEGLLNRDRKLSISTVNRRARKIVQKKWASFEGKIEMVPAKKVFAKLSNWSKKSYGVSFGPLSIAREIYAKEIDEEVVQIILAIEKRSGVPRQ